MSNIGTTIKKRKKSNDLRLLSQSIQKLALIRNNLFIYLTRTVLGLKFLCIVITFDESHASLLFLFAHTATGCKPIMLTQCMTHTKTLPPGHAQMPNYFGHVTEQDVRAGFNRFNALFLIATKGCSSMLARFLCPMYAPSCEGSKTPLPPCREFCVQTRSQCKRFINQAHKQNSFQWPTDLKCKNFPSKDEPTSCYMGPSTEVAISRPPPVLGKP